MRKTVWGLRWCNRDFISDSQRFHQHPSTSFPSQKDPKKIQSSTPSGLGIPVTGVATGVCFKRAGVHGVFSEFFAFFVGRGVRGVLAGCLLCFLVGSDVGGLGCSDCSIFTLCSVLKRLGSFVFTGPGFGVAAGSGCRVCCVMGTGFGVAGSCCSVGSVFTGTGFGMAGAPTSK